MTENISTANICRESVSQEPLIGILTFAAVCEIDWRGENYLHSESMYFSWLNAPLAEISEKNNSMRRNCVAHYIRGRT